MGTRGAFGVYVKGQTKVSYNHSDSYPEYLGNEIVTSIKKILGDVGIEEFIKKAIALRLVNEDDTPTEADLKVFAKNANLNVSQQSTDEWYCLLRDYQGDLFGTLSNGVMIDGEDFLGDSLFCEYAYIANLDTENLEFYEGFQKTKPIKSRYAEMETSNGDYYPVELKLSIPFSEIILKDPSDLADVMEKVAG